MSKFKIGQLVRFNGYTNGFKTNKNYPIGVYMVIGHEYCTSGKNALITNGMPYINDSGLEVVAIHEDCYTPIEPDSRAPTNLEFTVKEKV